MTQEGGPPPKDLAVLVADKNIEAVMGALLGRPEALGIRPVTWDCFVHPRRDPGCLGEASDFLRPLHPFYHYAVVMFDHAGCGQEELSPDLLANRVRQGLENNGWPERAEAVVLAPELEIWAWTSSPHLARCLGWAGREPPLREWLAGTGRWPPGEPKPLQPKESFEAALREARRPRSSAIYAELARSVTLKGHGERAFVQLRSAVRAWFGE